MCRGPGLGLASGLASNLTSEVTHKRLFVISRDHAAPHLGGLMAPLLSSVQRTALFVTLEFSNTRKPMARRAANKAQPPPDRSMDMDMSKPLAGAIWCGHTESHLPPRPHGARPAQHANLRTHSQPWCFDMFGLCLKKLSKQSHWVMLGPPNST